MRLAQALAIVQQPPPDGIKLKVALVCGFTPLHLQTFLTARLRLAFPERPVEITTGLYGDFLGNLERLAPESAEAITIVMEWQDLDPRLGLRSLNGWRQSDFSEIVELVRVKLARVRELIGFAPARTPLILQLPTLPLLPLDAAFPTWRANRFTLELAQLLNAFALQLFSNPAVKISSPARLDRTSPLAGRFDVQSELLSGFPYALPHAAAMSEILADLIYKAPPQKGLITDLDDTLWRGILGEVGSPGVSWDLDQNGHLHAVYQEFLRALAERGVLLAVASKNDPALVEEVFRRRDMLLPNDCIFPFEVHWGPKSESVSRILQAWNIGPDSVVFLDDSPSELAEVNSVHPAITCIQFPKAPQDVYALLERLRNLFAKPTVTEEDRLRLDSIRSSHILQKQCQTFAGNPDALLECAESILTFSFDKTSADPRVLDLLNKTNQFNLNGKRYTESTLVSLLQDPCVFLMKARYSDKFAPLGKIAILAGRVNGHRLRIDSWVMSCRAFSRRIEHAFLSHLYAKFDIDAIDFDYLPTEKNKPLRDFFAGLLGKPPGEPLCLTRDQFQQACPRLFHQIEEEL